MEKKYTILMALMGLEIGGAETHVVELAKELKKQGHHILIASNGGVYVQELEEFGIKHYKVPMNQRDIGKMIQSYHLMGEILEREQIDIVHSHARIPSFICGLLYKKKKFVFVTSAHWVFYTGMGLKYITNWGEKTIAVSDDIRDYLMEEYRVPKKDIVVTINGVDTEKFSPEISGELIYEEFGLAQYGFTIVYVSRMDESRALVARQLIAITEQLVEIIPDLQIVIVGSGDVFEELNQKAIEVNMRLKKVVITMTGARIDINQLIAVGDIFIGVSRATLEAMASGKTSIVAGNEGYIGIFNEEKLAIAQETNFCCRGCKEATEEELYQDILFTYQNMTKEDREQLGAYGREVIKEYYSVAKMATDCEKAYELAVAEKGLPSQREIEVIVSGYYGFNNTGDEAIMLSMHENIRQMGKNYQVTILSNKPEETKEKYGIHAVHRFDIFEVYKGLKKSDVLLSGGGSLLQDSTSTRSLLYYLSINAWAKMMGKKVMLYANGIGPVSGQRNRWLVKQVVNRADLITLREENSYDELLSMGVQEKKCFVTADPVFTMEGITAKQSKALLEAEGIPMDKPFVMVSVRNWKDIAEFLSKFASLCDEIIRRQERNIVFLCMQIPNDITVSERVRRAMKEKAYILKHSYTPYEVMGMIREADFILSMRLHTLIFAAKQKVPLIGFVYDPKIEYYLEKLNMPSAGKISSFDVEGTLLLVEDVIANKEQYRAILEEKEKILEEQAHKNEIYLKKLLEGKRKR